jgi:hypothetical protein
VYESCKNAEGQLRPAMQLWTSSALPRQMALRFSCTNSIVTEVSNIVALVMCFYTSNPPYAFLTSELGADEWPAWSSCRFTPGTHLIGCWVGPRGGLDAVDKRKIFCLCRKSNPNPPVVLPVTSRYICWAIPVLGGGGAGIVLCRVAVNSGVGECVFHVKVLT